METYAHAIPFLIFALLVSFMGTLRFFLSTSRSTSEKEVVRSTMPHYD